MPLLKSGYIKEEQIPAARQILRATAWTRFSALLELSGIAGFQPATVQGAD